MPEQTLTYDARMFKDTFESNFNFLNGFLRNVHRFSDRTAVTCPLRGKSWTYPQVNETANRLAHALLTDGVKSQDIVMYQLRTYLSHRRAGHPEGPS